MIIINSTERLFLLPYLKTNSAQTELPESNKTCGYINGFGIFNDRKYQLRLFDKIAAVLTCQKCFLVVNSKFVGC